MTGLHSLHTQEQVNDNEHCHNCWAIWPGLVLAWKIRVKWFQNFCLETHKILQEPFKKEPHNFPNSVRRWVVGVLNNGNTNSSAHLIKILVVKTFLLFSLWSTFRPKLRQSLYLLMSSGLPDLRTALVVRCKPKDMKQQ